MILRGVLDRSLGNMVCIRGFAKMGDLAVVSKADESYQRDLITDHKQEVLEFLRKRETLFFPEVILSYAIDELPLHLDRFKHNDSNLRITTRNNKNLYISTINIKNSRLVKNNDNLVDADIGYENNFIINDKAVHLNIAKIFNRTDGNHRLSAADEEKDDQNIQDLITPFCLLLLPQQFERKIDDVTEKIDDLKGFDGLDALTSEKLEKTIFHNINYKHIPLKKEHHYKMMIGDNTVFSDTDLTDNFGREYSLARQYLNNFNYDEFGSLKTALSENKYTFTHDLQKILLKKDGQQRKGSDGIHTALKLVNNIYANFPKIAKHQHHGLLVAFVYFAVRKEKSLSEKELNAFASWVVDNFVYEVAQKDANSIIAMYEKIIEKRYKEIFISMDFSKEYEITYQAIEGVIDSINQNLKEKIKLCPVRIDQFQTGYSYKLDEEILKQIEKCGLMIADLSNNNVNVYQEVGFAMGLNRNINNENILLLKQDAKQDETSDGEVGFNLRSTKQLRFKDTENLRQSLKKELLEYYKIN